MLIRRDTLTPWHGEAMKGKTLPLNAEVIWSDADLLAVDLVRCKPFAVPEGKQIIAGTASYADDGTETYQVEDAAVVRPRVDKGIVQDRLIAAGKMEDAYAALTQNAVFFARWFAPNPDWRAIYCDDPDAVAFVTALGLDPAVILAPGDVE